MAPHVDFYYWTGSTYTYLTVRRIDRAAQEAGVMVNWCPFNLRALLRENNHVPFPPGRAKTAYMWRDLERRAHELGVPYPEAQPIYPSDPETLNFKAALVAHDQGWGTEYAKAAFDWWFMKRRPPGMGSNLPDMLEAIGRDPRSVLAAIEAPEMEARMEASAKDARRLGLFGSPHFVVGDELFWGDDRLEAAIGRALKS